MTLIPKTLFNRNGMSESTLNFPVVSFGEILWNIQSSGDITGSAPMNVAYHLRNLGIHPTLITRVGLDAHGKRLIELLESLDVSTEFFQLDNELPTGKVNIIPNGNDDSSHEIQKPAAWDHISWDNGFENLMQGSRFFVFGSLAVRSVISSSTLFRLLEIAPFKVFDINLHPPHFTRKSIEDILRKTDLLKLNISELEFITGWFTRYYSEADRMQILQDKFQIQNIVVTKGSRGSVLNSNGTMYEHPGFAVEVADTTGSGDAFLAGMLFKISQSVPIEESIVFAHALAALVATKPGGCPAYTVEEIEVILSNNNNVSLPSH